MNCRRLPRGPSLLNSWHRLGCGECRATRAVDAIIARGIAEVQRLPADARGRERVLSALGLREATGARSVTRPRRRGSNEIVRRLGIGAGIAMLLIWAASPRVDRTGATALAETAAALKRVTSMHWKGALPWGGREQRWEAWVGSGHSRDEFEDQIIVDDGKHRRSYLKGSRNVLVYESGGSPTSILSGNLSFFQPGGLLAALQHPERFGPGEARIEKRDVVEQGRAAWRIQIDHTYPVPNGGRGVERRVVHLVDANTKLPISWQDYRKVEGKWKPAGHVDQIEYNVPIPENLFQLTPPGVRVVNVGFSRFANKRVATRISSGKHEVILRAIERTTKGDVVIWVAAQKPSDTYRPVPPKSIELASLTDDRGMRYVSVRRRFWPAYHRIFWMVPPEARQPGAPQPRRFTLTVALGKGESITFRGIPAPPAIFDDMTEMPGFQFFRPPAADYEQERENARAAARGRS